MTTQDTRAQTGRRPVAADADPDHRRRGVRIVVAATVAMAMGFGGLGLISVFLGPLEADLGWSRADTSLGYAFATAGMAIGGVVWGRLTDRLDVRVLVLIGGVGMVGPVLAMSTLHSLVGFYGAQLVYGGFGFSALYAALLSTSGEWFPQRRGLVTGLVTAGGALGQGLVPLAANVLIGAFGWRWACLGLGVLMLGSLAVSLPGIRWPRGTRAPVTIHATLSRTSSGEARRVATMGLAAFLCCACMGVPVVHMASFIGAICGSPDLGVRSLVVAMAAGAVGRICFGQIADRVGPLKAYAMASATQTACVLAFPTLGDGTSFMVLSAVFGFGFAGNMTCLALCVRQCVPAERFGGAIGLVMMAAWVGMATGGYAGGLLFQLTSGYTLAFLLAGSAGIANLAVIGAFWATTELSAGRRRIADPRVDRTGGHRSTPAIR